MGPLRRLSIYLPAQAALILIWSQHPLRATRSLIDVYPQSESQQSLNNYHVLKSYLEHRNNLSPETTTGQNQDVQYSNSRGEKMAGLLFRYDTKTGEYTWLCLLLPDSCLLEIRKGGFLDGLALHGKGAFLDRFARKVLRYLLQPFHPDLHHD